MSNNKNQESVSTGISRRDALKYAAFAGIGVVGASSLAACTTNESSAGTTSQNWDKEVDVLVVGTGTVIHSAIACSEIAGSSILVVEKDADLFGGTSALSGGGHALAMTDFDAAEGIVDSREEVLAYMKAAGDSRMDENVQAAFVDNANDFAQFVLSTHGWSKWGHINKAFADYYELYPGSLPDGFGHGSWYPFNEKGNLMAPAQWEAYHEYVDSHENIELMMGTVLDSLITDDSGAVVGATISEGSSTQTVKAHAVIIGTGGFEHNEDMRKQHLPFPYYRSNGKSTNTGDGHRAGAAIGAGLAYMDATFGCPHFDVNKEWQPGMFMMDMAGSDAFAPRGFPYSLMVNKKGRRFADESTMYDTFNRSFGCYDTGTMEFVNIPGFWICDSVFASTFFLPGSTSPEELPDFVRKFDTLEALADEMGIEKEALLAEVAAFNANAASGVDPQFHRGKTVSNNTLAMMGAYRLLPGATLPASVLGPVSEAPYYCCRYVPGMMGGTRGGLHINENSQVLDVNGMPIAGLYAVGNCSSGVAGYWAGGATLGQGGVMGYLAAKHITSAG